MFQAMCSGLGDFHSMLQISIEQEVWEQSRAEIREWLNLYKVIGESYLCLFINSVDLYKRHNMVAA